VIRGEKPQVRASVDGISGTFEVDTGSRGSLALTRAFADRNELARKYDATPEVVLGAAVGGPVRARLVRVKTLELGDVVVANPVAALTVEESAGNSDLAGNIGNGILRRFSVTFDFPGGALYLEKNASFAQRDIYDRAGLWVERGHKGFEVMHVVERGAGELAGLKPGDVIVAIDGRPWTAVSLPALRAMFRADAGRKVRLTLDGGAQRTVVLRDLV